MTLTALDRHIACDGVFNLRDLGGYTTADGRRVRWRQLFRADGLHRVAPGADLTIGALGWRTVIDLRTTAELDDGRFSGDGIHAVHLPILRDTWNAVVDPRDAEDAVAFLSARYLEMSDTGAEAIAAAFQLCASTARRPVVFHCSAGKDRTGVLAALLLATLGVDDEQIAADYHLSAKAMDRLIDWVTTNRPDVVDRMARQPEVFLASPPDAILRFLDGLRDRHGSPQAYLAAIGVGEETVASLREELLERP